MLLCEDPNQRILVVVLYLTATTWVGSRFRLGVIAASSDPGGLK